MQKLIIFKWISFILSVGIFSYLIIGDIYADNNANFKLKEDVNAEIITPAEPDKISLELESACNHSVTAYQAQNDSDNNKLSDTIVEKYKECTGIESKPTAETKKVKDKK